MKVRVGSYAWLPKRELTEDQLNGLRSDLTIVPRRMQVTEDEEVKPIFLYRETAKEFGIAREYFYRHKRPHHEVIPAWTEGDRSLAAPMGTFEGTLRAEQAQCLAVVAQRLMDKGELGGMIRAVPGWGKTVMACALAAHMKVPTLVVVHKNFLMNQWQERIQQFLPEALIGRVQQDECDYEGKSIVLGMVHSLSTGRYPQQFYDWPGLMIVDECHRIAALTWSPTPGLFKAKYRIGFSATPRRKDGADNVFHYHLGPLLFAAKEQRLQPKVKRVRTSFQFYKTKKFNPNLLPRPLMLNFLCKSKFRNKAIADQIVAAVQVGRKCIVLSERLEHLNILEQEFLEKWPLDLGYTPSFGYYVGGRKEAELKEASKADVIMATSQFASEGLDIPALDTLFLTTPLADVEQAVGRILRPCEGKKEPIVVDFRDDKVKQFKKAGERRDHYYQTVTA